jgi:hypothetical protein
MAASLLFFSSHGSAAQQPTLMAILPPNSVAGIGEELRVLEDLSIPDAPMVFVGKTFRVSLAKTTEAQYASAPSEMWGGLGLDNVTSADADLLGNALTADGRHEPLYGEVAAMAPPVISSAPAKCGDYELEVQTFVGSRVCAQKHVFSPDGQKQNLDSPLHFHLRTSELRRENASAGLLGGWLPAVRYRWSLAAGGFAEMLSFAQAESTDDRPLHVASQQPVWLRYLNVSADGALLHAQYVDSHARRHRSGPRPCVSGLQAGLVAAPRLSQMM